MSKRAKSSEEESNEQRAERKVEGAESYVERASRIGRLNTGNAARIRCNFGLGY
jgi:hypothetical protein